MPLKRKVLLLALYFTLLLSVPLSIWIPVVQEGLGKFEYAAWDFVSFYMAGDMVLHGHSAALYNLEEQTRWQEQLLYPHSIAIGVQPFYNPPTLIPLLLPFSLGSLSQGYRLWLAFNLILLAGFFLIVQHHLKLDGSDRFLFLLAILSFYPLTIQLVQGQTAMLVLIGLTLAYLGLRSGHEFLAGLALALCAIKPQLVLPLFLVLLFKRRWSALAGLATGTAALALPLLPVLGPANMVRWATLSVAGFQAPATHGDFPLRMQSWQAVVVALGASGTAGAVLLVLLSLLTLGVLAWVWKGAWQPGGERFPLQMAATVWLTLLLSPHLYMHDLTLWLLPGALLAYAVPMPSKRAAATRTVLLLLGGLSPLLAMFLFGEMVPLTVPVACGLVGLTVALLTAISRFASLAYTGPAGVSPAVPSLSLGAGSRWCNRRRRRDAGGTRH